MEIRPASPEDAEGMARVQAEIFAARGFGLQGDVSWTRARYIDDPAGLACTVAVERGEVLGFQSLKRASAGDPYNLPEGWGIIGTHVTPTAARRGVGRALFGASLEVARQAGLATIDATIAAANPGALAYYEAMGFVTYAETETTIRKRFDLPAA